MHSKGADLVIESSGHDSSLAAVLDYVRIGGRVTFVAISIGRKVPVELGKIQSKSLTIKGTIGSPGVWPAALRFLARTKLDLSPIQTHFFDLTNGKRPAQNTSLVVSITPRRCQALRPLIASFFCSSSRLTKPRPGTLTVRPSAKRS
jgi:hypothetical protein